MIFVATYTDDLSEHTVNTQHRILTYTGPDQWLYNHDRLGLTTGSAYDRLGLRPARFTTGWVKSLRIHWKYTVVYYDIHRSRPTTL